MFLFDLIIYLVRVYRCTNSFCLLIMDVQSNFPIYFHLGVTKPPQLSRYLLSDMANEVVLKVSES